MFQMYPLYYHTLNTDSVLCTYFVHYGNEETELMMGAEIWPDTPRKKDYLYRYVGPHHKHLTASLLSPSGACFCTP